MSEVREGLRKLVIVDLCLEGLAEVLIGNVSN